MVLCYRRETYKIVFTTSGPEAYTISEPGEYTISGRGEYTISGPGANRRLITSAVVLPLEIRSRRQRFEPRLRRPLRSG